MYLYMTPMPRHCVQRCGSSVPPGLFTNTFFWPWQFGQVVSTTPSLILKTFSHINELSAFRRVSLLWYFHHTSGSSVRFGSSSGLGCCCWLLLTVTFCPLMR